MPEPVEPTPADLQTFRDRMKAAIAEAGTTARAIEQSLGLSRGTFTRIYGGRRQLDTDLLTRAAGELGVDPQALVGGTALAALLQAPAAEEIAAPEPEEAEETATDDAAAVVEPAVVETEDATAGTEVEAAVEPEVVEVSQAAEGAEASGEPPVDEAGEAAADAGEQERDAAEADRAQRRAEGAGDTRRQRRKLLDVPARAAVAIAGGLALVGGTLVALLRRR